MTTTKSTIDLVARVHKLLALSTSSNVHEAASALARAQELIDRHRLHALVDAGALDDVNSDADIDADIDVIDDGTGAPLEVARRPRRWRRVLAEGLAFHNGGVVHAVEVSGGVALCFVGTAADRAVVIALFGWLTKTLEWLSASAGPAKPRHWHEAFRVGAADVVVRRVGVADVEGADADRALAVVDVARAARRARAARVAAARGLDVCGRDFLVDARGFVAGQQTAQTAPLRPKHRR